MLIYFPVCACSKENAALKQLRRQQEATLAEVLEQRTEVLKWVADEKHKTHVWCEEQRQAALKERRAAAKLVV
jgi:hypothetical protein